jgi:hypothetical protein
MLSKLVLRATLCFLLAGCRSVPWSNEPVGSEFNLAFRLERNLLYLPTAKINGHSGRFLFASAHAHTVIDPQFASAVGSRQLRLQLTERESVPLAPVILDLHGLGDALIGAEAWSSHAVTIDYRAGLITYQKQGIYTDGMTLYQFRAEPAVLVDVDGRSITAIVDTTLPDTLLLPRGGAKDDRRQARVSLAGVDFGSVDVALADVARARIGNRLLSRFLVTIDYGRQQVGLWRDPRTSLR